MKKKISDLFKTYSAICAIICVIIIGTKFYYGLYLNIQNAFVQINKITNTLDKLDSDVDNLTVEIEVLKKIIEKKEK